MQPNQGENNAVIDLAHIQGLDDRASIAHGTYRILKARDPRGPHRNLSTQTLSITHGRPHPP